MRRNMFLVPAALLVIAGGVGLFRLQGQQPTKSPQPMPECPMMKSDAMNHMNERGDAGMGFSQAKTTHHFYLTKTGGTIEVLTNDAKDTQTRDQIRQHFSHLVMMFSEGNFDIPMFVHDQVPPGVAEMKQLKASIDYKFEETKQGGRVLISSSDPQAVSAVQSFLRFQITEHKTGDSLEVN